MVVADFNGDGQPDLALVDDTGISVLLGNSNGTFQAATNFAAGSIPYALTTGDFKSGGSPDLAVANYNTTGTVSLLLNTCVTTRVHLAIVRSNATVTISWPFPSTGFVLESTTSLSPADWQPATKAPTNENGGWQLTVPITQKESYFRLHKP